MLRTGLRTFLAVVLTIAVSVFALAGSNMVKAASTTKSLSTNFTLVNLGSQEATVTVAYYKDDGNAWAAAPGNTSFTIPANGGQKIVYQYFDTTMTTGRGSAVISSNQQLGALAQIVARNQTPTSGAYSGFTSSSSTWYIPLVSRRGNSASGTTNSQIIIQNADSTAVDVTVTLTARSGSTGNYTKNITGLKVGSSFYYDIDDEGPATTPWFGAATVTAAAGKKITVVSNFFLGADGMQTFNAFPIEKVGTTWLAPIFYSRLPNNLSSPISIQNLSGGSIGVGGIQATCTADAGYSPATINMSNTTAVANFESYAFNPVTDLTIPSPWQGACRITASGNIVAVVLPRFLGTSNNAAYEAINASSTDTRVFVPLIAKRLPNGFATTVIIQNLSQSQTANVTLTYTPGSGVTGGPYTTSTTIAPGASLVQNQRVSTFAVGGTTMPEGWSGTLLVQSTNGVPISGIGQNTYINGQPGDTYFSYNLFTTP
jgi:hypothetical protein